MAYPFVDNKVMTINSFSSQVIVHSLVEYIEAPSTNVSLESDKCAQPNDRDWEQLIFLASLHGVIPQVSLFLSRRSTLDVPERISQWFHGEHIQNAQRQLANSAFLKTIRSEWMPRRVLLPVKGVSLAQACYRSIGDRMSTDVDIWLEARDVRGVLECMESQGFVRSSGGSIDVLEKELFRLGSLDMDLSEHGARLYHVEFHTKPGAWFYGLNFTINDLMAFVLEEQVPKGSVYSLSPTGHLVVMILHHGVKDGWSKWRQLLDLALLLKVRGDEIDWSGVDKLCSRLGIRTSLEIGLKIIDHLFGVKPIRPEFYKENLRSIARLANRRISQLSTEGGQSISPFHRLVFRLRSTDGITRRLTLVVRFLWSKVVWRV